MKTPLIILLVAAVIAVALVVWKQRSSRKYVNIDDLDFKEGETTHINLRDLDPNDPLAALAKDTAQKQAAGLDGAVVTVHSVTEHDRFKAATPHPGQKLIAVDVTFADFKDGLGLAGVQLIDGEREEAESYGGDAYQVYLNADGTLHAKQGYEYWDTTANSNSVRLYLVYSAPKSVKKIGLGYWGRIIVDRPYEVERSKQPIP